MNAINPNNYSLPIETTRFSRQPKADVITIEQGANIKGKDLGSLLNIFPARVRRALKESNGNFEVVVDGQGNNYLVLNVQDGQPDKPKYLNIYA